MYAHVDMAEQQQKKLLAALVLAVDNLQRPEILVPALRELGKRDAGYGVRAGVGGALLDTFAEFLGSQWTPELRAAWTEAYGGIATLMLEGANGAKA